MGIGHAASKWITSRPLALGTTGNRLPSLYNHDHNRTSHVTVTVTVSSSITTMRPAAPWPLRAISRTLHSTASRAANVAPILGTGPPPPPPPPTPTPAVRNMNERIERRRKQAELLKQAKVIRTAKDGRSTTLRKRFWKDVSVQEVDGALQIHLDSRPLRHPQTKDVIRLPASKPNLAFAIALEWDALTSSLQATKQHLIPLTSLVCRALDVERDDASSAPGAAKTIRGEITASVLRYLDTDSLLCWAPPAGEFDPRNDAGESLRDVQKRTTHEIVSFMTTHVWPGIRLEPVLDGDAIMPRKQEEGVREVVQGWVAGLSPWEITGLERAVLAGKSLVAAARFITEWTEGPLRRPNVAGHAHFGVEEAAKTVNLEVDWQVAHWGEVEDTHDVNNEDVRRQLGSVVLLVSGTGKHA
ncbi:ATP12 ATPase family protein [Metarhizium album ARSEF 1941]|uniref:ATP12 ATPase family protein n=1 Tax=Metarhizium album (strain ARSEF 1941) TaxID=1081103 RepID=A0A0B2WZ53_METAS|nr:ATP12 ATPase family protein [Metarhizium album ARSEF 1941]KHN98712.1 ATP12 ATPase family protein [Metarhizium album ARSEF 1941]